MKNNKFYLGAFLFVLAWAIIPIMDGIAKHLSASLPVTQIAWARFLVIFIISLPIVGLSFFKKKAEFFISKNIKLQILRNIFIIIATFLFFYSISKISLTTTLALSFVYPLLVTLFSPIFLGEKVGMARWIAVAYGFGGTLLIIKPGFGSFELATVAALGAGFFYAMFIISTRRLSLQDNPLTTLTLTGVIGLLVLSFPTFLFWENPSQEEWLLLIAMGTIGAIGHLLIILSHRLAQASLLAPFSFFEIITNTLIGFYVFSEFPDIISWLGIFIIIGSGVYISWREREKNN